MPGWSQRPLFKNPTNMTGGGPVGMPKGMSIPGYQDGKVVEEMPTDFSQRAGNRVTEIIDNTSISPYLTEVGFFEDPSFEKYVAGARLYNENAKTAVALGFGSAAPFVADSIGALRDGYQEMMRSFKQRRGEDSGGIKSIPGYGQGSVVQGGDMVEEMPAYRQEQLAKEAEYQKAIEKTASLFLNPFQGLLRDYDFNLDYFARNLSGGHQIPKEQVMQDLRKSISAQRKEMPVKEGFMGKARRRYSGIDKASPMSEEMLDADGFETKSEGIMEKLQKKMGGFNSLGNAEDINFAPTGLASGGIVGLENGGMMPELFESEEIVETNPMINEMAEQGGTGIASVSAEPASGAMPERNVPNERGIIELAMDAEEVEDDEPMVAMAKQEAQSRLDEEFNILKSTAQAEASQGRDPSFIIKESMDSLARSANVIEQEVIENTPEIPTNTNLLSSEDLEPYQQELVAVFEMPEIGGEEPLMDTSILTAKNGGLIPGYQDGDVVLPPEWAWIDQEFIDAGLSLEQAESEMVKKHGPTVLKMRELYAGQETESEKKKRRRSLSSQKVLEEIRQEKDDPRRSNLLRAMSETDFMGSTTPSVLESFTFSRGQTGESIQRMSDELNKRYIKENIDLLKEYNKTFDDEGNIRPMVASEETVVETEEKNEVESELDRAIAALAKARKDGTETPDWAKEILSNALKETPENNKEAEKTTDSVEVSPSPSPSPRSSSVADLLKRIEDLKTTMDTGIDTAKTDVGKRAKDLTDVYDVEVQKSTDAVNAANTSINNALTSYEKRIPELARLVGLRSPGTAIFQKQNAAKEAEIRMKNGVDETKMELGKLEKELQEARRENNLAASRDIKARQLDAINNLNELAIKQGVDLELNQLTTMLTHEMRLDEIRMQAALAKTNEGVNQQLISAMNDLKTSIANETDPDAKALLESELDTYRTVVLGQKSPQAQITTALLDGNYKELFSAYSVEDMQRYAPSLQGEKTIQIEGIPQPLTGSFPDFYNYMVSKKKPNKEVYYTDKEIVEMWKRGKG